MKFKFIRNILLGAFTTAMISAFTGTNAMAATPGNLDEADDYTISGWAWDSQNPDTAVEVHLYIYEDGDREPAEILTVIADEQRDDLIGICGNGAHGFSYSIDWSSMNGLSYRIEAYAITAAGPVKLNGDARYSAEAEADTEGLVSLGTFKTTAYCPCKSCSRGWGRKTSSGVSALSGLTVAVDPNVIPIGTELMIDGHVYVAEDCGGGVKGNHIDIFFDNHAQVDQYGRRNVEVFLVTPDAQ